MSGVEFCDECGVSMDLHPYPEDQDDPGCETAGHKADVLSMFGQGLS